MCASLDEQEWKLLDLEALLESVIQLSTVNSRDVEIRRKYDGELRIEGSAYQLMQLFMILLLHSVESSNGEGTLTITTREDGAHLTVTFEDERPRAAPGTENPDIARGALAGLGLPICEFIVRSHDGVFSIEPAERGARTRVRLPRRSSRPRQSDRTLSSS